MNGTYPSRKYGFSIIELAVVVSIISILATLAIPAFKRSRDNVRIGALENDIRQYEQVLDTYQLDAGYFPPTQNTAGVMPDGMENRMSEAWKLPSPIGGVYRWIYTTEDDPLERSAYIDIVHTPETPIQIAPERLIDIDKDIDDGDPSTGSLRITGQNLRYYIRL